MKEFTTYVRSKQPGIIGLTSEDERVVLQVATDAASMDMKVQCWTATNGFYDPTVLESDRQYDACSDPQEAIVKASALPGRAVVIFRRFHFYLEPSYGNYIQLVGLLSDACEMLKALPRDEAKTFVFLMPRRVLPEELKDLVAVLNFPLPTLEDLKSSVTDIASARKLKLQPGELEEVASAGLGLTYAAAENCFARCLIEAGRFEPLTISRQKKGIIEASGLVTYIEPEGGLELVAGLEEVKRWAMSRRRALTPEAVKYGLPPPKGMVISGVSGCGKSKLVECLIMAWKVVGVAFDMGTLFDKFQGVAEARMRELIALLTSIAPCICRIDEFDKAFSGMGGGGEADGGVGNRMLQSFLSWSAEKKVPVFLAATANDVTKLPIELMRSGRFDAVFAVDLPHYGERKDIVSVHIGKRKRDPEKFNLELLAEKSDGFTGADIEQSVIEGMYLAFEKDEEVATEHVLAAMAKLVPLSVSAPQKIEEVRKWAKECARPASSPYVATTAAKKSGGRFADLG